MNKERSIEWIGRTTDGNRVFTAKGTNYKNIFEQIQEKYSTGLANFFDNDSLEIAMLEYYEADLDEFDVTTDGIGNYEKFEKWQKDKELNDVIYKRAIENNDGNAYYQKWIFVEE